jgi:hypothetical protein
MTNEYGQQPYPGHQPPIPGYGAPAGSGYPQQQAGYPGTPPGGQPAYPGTPPGGQPVYAGQPGQPYPQGPGGYGSGYGPAPVEKPGGVTGAAVLGFIQAGLTLITTVLFTMGLFNAQGIADSAEVDSSPLIELWIVDIAQFAGVVLLIFGAVQLLGGSGRMLFLIGAGLEIALSLYWMIRFAGMETEGLDFAEGFRNSIIVFAIGFAILPIIGLILAAGSAAGRYIEAKQGQGQR